MQPKIADTGVLKDVKTDIESSSTNSNKTGEKDVGITIEEAREKYNISDPAIVLGINAMNTLTRISSATTF